jgi:hypothetical protein
MNRAAIANSARRVSRSPTTPTSRSSRQLRHPLRDERRNRIRAVPTKYKCDNELLNTLVNLTEWPTPITGKFDPSSSICLKKS